MNCRCKCSIPRPVRILSVARRSRRGGEKAAEQTKPVQKKSTPEPVPQSSVLKLTVALPQLGIRGLWDRLSLGSFFSNRSLSKDARLFLDLRYPRIVIRKGFWWCSVLTHLTQVAILFLHSVDYVPVISWRWIESFAKAGYETDQGAYCA